MLAKRLFRRRLVFGVSTNVVVLGIVSLFADMSTEMIYPLIPLFLVSVLGATFIDVGFIEGVAESTASILKIVSGYVSDKFGKRKPLVYSGYAFAAIAKPLLAFATAWQQVFAIRFVDRLGKGVRDSARDAIVSESRSLGVGRSFGFQRSLDTLGAVIGPLIALTLFGMLSFRGLFLLAFIPGALATVLVIFFVKETAGKQGSKELYKISFSVFDRDLRVFLFGLGLFFVGNSSDAFLFFASAKLGYSNASCSGVVSHNERNLCDLFVSVWNCLRQNRPKSCAFNRLCDLLSSLYGICTRVICARCMDTFSALRTLLRSDRRRVKSACVRSRPRTSQSHCVRDLLLRRRRRGASSKFDRGRYLADRRTRLRLLLRGGHGFSCCSHNWTFCTQ
jgi:MFS family permease